MGLEAETTCTHIGNTFEVKALLESADLILRGELSRKFPLTTLSNIRAVQDMLLFTAESEDFALHLGAAKATTWAKKLTTPPPALAQKLGLSATAKAMVISKVEDEALAAALKGHTVADSASAAFLIAVLRSEQELASLLKTHKASTLPLWLANVKGANSPLGENAIRTALRAAGFKDVKTCAVSDTLSATRYVKAK